MKNSLTIVAVIALLAITHGTFSASHNLRDKFKSILTQKNNSLTQKIHKMGLQSEKWNVYDWYWFIDGSMGSVEDILNVNFEKHAAIFYAYDYVLSIFDGYALKDLKKWNKCSKFTVTANDYAFNSSFDSKGNILEYNISKKCTYTITYNSNNLPTEWAVREWDQKNQIWLPYKYKFTYDSNNNLNTFIITFEEDGVWYNWERFDLAYTNDNNLKNEIYYKWNFSTNKWDKKNKWEFNFTNDGNIAENITFNWNINSGDWEKHSYKTVYTYTAKGKKLEDVIDQVWDTNTGKWENEDLKFSYTYDTNERLLNEICYKWDKTSKKWNQYGKKFTFTYNKDGNFNEESQYLWDETLKDWKPGEFKYTYTYNSNGDLSENIDYVFSETSNEWVVNNKFTFEYDANGMPKKCKMSQHDNNQMFKNEWNIKFDITNPIITTHFQELNGKKSIIYSMINNELNIKIAGNSFKNNKMKIFDLHGRLIQELQPIYKIDGVVYKWNCKVKSGSSISNKLRFYRLQMGDAFYSGKLHPLFK